MKCPVCGGKTIVIQASVPEGQGGVVLRHKGCKSCPETFWTEETIVPEAKLTERRELLLRVRRLGLDRIKAILLLTDPH